MLDEAVGIDYIKRYISDLDLNSADVWRPEVAPSNGKKVAVVGAGPAGLSAAYYLAIKGYRVDILEGQPEPGGMLRYGIPSTACPRTSSTSRSRGSSAWARLRSTPSSAATSPSRA